MYHCNISMPGSGRRQLRRIGAAVLSVVLAGAAAMPAAAQGTDAITSAKLGAVYAFSGPVAIYSTTIKNGLDMAVSELNAKGDLKIDLVLEDDRSTKDDAINVYQKFIQRDNALLIFGPLIGGQVFAAGPLAQKAKVPVMLTSVAIVALGSILSGYLSGNMAAAPAIQAAIAALAAYMVGTGLESQSAAQIRPDVPAVRTIASPKR